MSSATVLVLLIPCLLASPALSAERCNPEDKAALLRIKEELGNPSSLSSWNATADCCNRMWQFISCDTDTHTYRVNLFMVSAIVLPRPTPIPASIADLPFLNFLTFYRVTNLAGPIPTTITHLTKLRYLTISRTNVSGAIPDLSAIKTLVTLDFSYNELSGALPPWLSSLPNLVGITFDGNFLSGQIPASYGSFSNLFTSMTMSRNRISGRIPATFTGLNLSFVDLSRNALEGDASVLFGADKNTNKIVLASNSLAFDLGKVGLSKDMAALDLRNNRIYGKLPEGLTRLKFLHNLNVSYNGLCGQIPQGGNLQRFDVYSYANNMCLCGSPLPTCLQQ